MKFMCKQSPLAQQSCIFAFTRLLCSCASSGSGDGRDSEKCTEANATNEGGTNNPSAPTLYDMRKYGHCLPENNVRPRFEPLHIPTGVFRCTEGEILGPKADKCSYYKNPEYFSFHHMSYYDFHLFLSCNRNPAPNTGRKP